MFATYDPLHLLLHQHLKSEMNLKRHRQVCEYKAVVFTFRMYVKQLNV